MNVFEMIGPEFRIDLLEYRATDACRAAIDRNTLDHMVVTAEQARINRQCDLHVHKMYMIRMSVPPNPRLVSVLFIENMEGERCNIVAYFDEIEHILKRGYDSGDIKKFSGSPFDEKPQTAPPEPYK